MFSQIQDYFSYPRKKTVGEREGAGGARQEGDTQGEGGREGELSVEQLLRDCSVVIGLHPDQATEHIVNFALANGKPFAVVRGEEEKERKKNIPLLTHSFLFRSLVVYFQNCFLTEG
jgi:hypothetical protein